MLFVLRYLIPFLLKPSRLQGILTVRRRGPSVPMEPHIARFFGHNLVQTKTVAIFKRVS